MSDLWGPLALSLQIACAATVLSALFTIPLAHLVARRPFPGRSVVEAIITLPLVLPPTVVGYLLIVLFGHHGWVGRWLWRWFGYSIIFRLEGAILAATVVAIPLLYLPAKAAFAGIDRDLLDTATLMGAGRLEIFWRVSVPLARRDCAGLILAFAGAGEFGATMMVYGWTPGRTTLPISVYVDFFYGALSHAAAAVLLLTAISLGLILAYNRSAAD